MPILLGEQDLAPLYRRAANMDALLPLIEASMMDFNSAKVAGQARVETSLLEPKNKYRIMTSAVPGAGQGMRISALFRGAKDAYFIVLFDGERGDLLALVAGKSLNVWRTGAPGGVASKYLAPKGAESLGLIGSGRQARGQITAIARELPGIKRVKVYSSTKEHRESFAKEMGAFLNLEVDAVSDAKSAVTSQPIVSLATSSRSAVIEPDWIEPGALVVTITSGQLPPQTVASSRVIASWKEELLGGEAPRQPYMAMIADGSWSAEKIAGELGDVILGKIPGRVRDNQTVVFESVGMALWDTVAAAWAYRWAVEQGAGTKFSLE